MEMVWSKDERNQFFRRTSLRQVQVMVTLLDCNSMSETADRLGLSVAAVSRMTQRFEENFGVKLFYSGSRRCVLLPEARELLARLRPVLHEIETFAAGIPSDRGS